MRTCVLVGFVLLGAAACAPGSEKDADSAAELARLERQKGELEAKIMKLKDSANQGAAVLQVPAKEALPDSAFVEKCRALGQARVEAIGKIKSKADWDKLWPAPKQSFPFKFGSCWTQCIQYSVKDFAAEAGFFMDVLGFPSNAFDAHYAMLTSPNHAFYVSFVPASDENPCTPPESVRLEYMVQDIHGVADALEKRGIAFEKKPEVFSPMGSSMYIADLRTPNGIRVRLWCYQPKTKGSAGGEEAPPVFREVDSAKDTLVLEGCYAGIAPKELFKYWIEPQKLTAWWPKKANVEARVGGAYELSWPARNSMMRGQFLSLVMDESLEFTWKWDHETDDQKPLKVSVSFKTHPEGGTLLRIAHGPYADSEKGREERKDTLEGWQWFGAELKKLVTK